LLGQIFDGHVLVTSSTSIGHQAALSALLTEKDAFVMDHQVHYSVQMASRIAQANGTKIAIVRHNHLERAIDTITDLARRCRTVWFAVDGVFSMYGDLAPLNLLHTILDIAPNVRLYVDDAHGMSWIGKHGRGSFLSRMPMHHRMVMATSLNKAFAAGGGCLVFPTAEERDHVLRCGGPMVFSGPVQPPMLGAAVASARLHLTDEINVLQDTLLTRTEQTNALMHQYSLPLLVENEAPIFFLRMGLPRVAMTVAKRMMDEDGIFVNVSAWPSVPMKRAGIRFAVNTRHTYEDIERAISALARHIPQVLRDENVERRELDELFAQAVPAESLKSERYRPIDPRVVMGTGESTEVSSEAPAQNTHQLHDASLRTKDLRVEHHRSIAAVNQAEWNHMLGTVGSCSWDALRLAESAFSNQEKMEYNWEFHYVIVRDNSGAPVAATFFTVSLNKDDMLMRDEISRRIEERREDEPYFLTSTTVMMGSGFSEGNHLYLDKSRNWRAAIMRLLDVANALYEHHEAAATLLRDLPDNDPELDAFLGNHGFVRVPMFTSHYLEMDWANEEEYLSRLSRRQRKHLRQISARAEHYSRRVYGKNTGQTLSTAEIDHLYTLYRNVADRKYKLNVFPLPQSLFPMLLSNPSWEVVTIHLSPEVGGPPHGEPVAWYAAHHHDNHYAPFLCGLDYQYVFQHGAYRNMLYEMIHQAKSLNVARIHMGMDADLEKARFGSWTQKNCLYLQVREHFNSKLMREIVAEVGMKQVS